MRHFGLIGRTLKHSFSQIYFTQKFQALGLENHQYDLFELPSIQDFPKLLAANPDLCGLTVTVPYKEQLIPYLDALAPSAARIGAVNVVKFAADGRLIGHNTDYVGFRDSLQSFFPLQNAAALVLGTGGASKAVMAALEELGIDYRLVSRQGSAEKLSYDDLTPELIAKYQLIINTTPLGTFPNVDECPLLPYEALTSQHYLYDLVYNPTETLFLQKGREAGAHTKNGIEMLYRQADVAWEIWNA